MRQLLPTTIDPVEPAALSALVAAEARPASLDRPWLAVNMIASLDGATAVDGRSGGLGGPADKQVFAALRGMADCILVAAQTVRAEHYGPPRPSAEIRAERRARGQEEVPRIAIITASLDLDLDAPLFTDAAVPPIVITSERSDPVRRATVSERAEVVLAGPDRVDLDAALSSLGERGASVVLGEGGPSLNGGLIAAGLIDELCLSVAPVLAGGESARLGHGPPGALTRMTLARLFEDDGLLFLRYVRDN